MSTSGQALRRNPWAARRRRLAWAAALCVAGSAQALIVANGDVNTSVPAVDVAGVTTVDGTLFVGSAGSGSVVLDGGSRLSVWQMMLANGGAGGQATLSLSGAGTWLAVTRQNNTNLDLGGAGTAVLSVLDGASLSYGDLSANCVLNCRSFIGNAAGSSGTLQLSGAGSSFVTGGRVTIGQTTVFSTAVGDALNYGQPGATTTGLATVSAGATARSSTLTVGNTGNISAASTGTEFANGALVIDGTGSAWNLVRDAAQTGSWTLLAIGNGRNTGGAVTVRNGGALRLDGSAVADQYSGLVLGSTGAGSNANGSLLVTGAGSFVEFAGGRSYLNIGNTAGGAGQVSITGGGRIVGAGDGDTGLTYVNIGRNGGTGTLTVSGADSLLRLNGRQSDSNVVANSVAGGGAVLMIGRTDGTAAGNGTLNVLGGGQVVIDTRALSLTNANGQTGFDIGWDAGAQGSATVSGAGSSLRVLAGSGLAPYISVGRNGGSGQLMVANGGVVEVLSPHVSVPNPLTYLPGDLLQFDVGRRTNAAGGASTGTVTVTGAGSRLTLGGGADALMFIGRGSETSGTLNVTAGGLLQTSGLLIGDRGNGVANIVGGRVETRGNLNGGPSAGFSGGIVVGRGDGVGTLNIAGGATVLIDGSSPVASLRIAGNSTVAGGTGTVNLSGGSTLTVSSPQAAIGVASADGGGLATVGSFNLSGAGTHAAIVGSGARLLIGSAANAVGTVVIGAGASLAAESFVGVAHDGSASSAGQGTLIVNGTLSTGTLFNGLNGYVGGSGLIQGNVVNQGRFNPGNSPGTLHIDGQFDNTGGTLVLEVQYDAATGTWLHDELVLGPAATLALGHGQIRFAFLGSSNPNAFIAQGGLDLDTFFKVSDAQGQLSGISSSPLLAHGFDQVQFSGEGGGYALQSFTLDATSGALGAQVSAVPAPPAWWLMSAGLLGLARRLRGRR